MHYVRPGRRTDRLHAEQHLLAGGRLQPQRQGDVVLNNNVSSDAGAQNAIISGLPAGQYGVCETYGDSVSLCRTRHADRLRQAAP